MELVRQWSLEWGERDGFWEDVTFGNAAQFRELIDS